MTSYPVLVEKNGELVAQFKCTIAVLPKSTVILSGDLPFPKERFETEKKISDLELISLLESDLWKKEDKKKVAGTKVEEEKKQ